MSQGELGFEAVLIEAVHEGLNTIGSSVSDLVLFYLEKNPAIRLEEHFIDPDAFDDGLRDLLGSGAMIVEKLILESLYRKLGNNREIGNDFKFADEVKKARKCATEVIDSLQ